MPTQRTTPRPPARPIDGHKGTFGTVVVVGGSETMIGAPALTATAALRAGTGLAKVLAERRLIPHILTIQPSATGIVLPEPTDVAALDHILDGFGRGTVLAVGPGMGRSRHRQALVQSILQRDLAVVLDADGLNNFADNPVLADPPKPAPSRGGSLVMTPHPGEFARLAEAARMSGLDPIDPQKRPAAALALARRHRAVVLLKGHRTVIADADGEHYAVNETGNAALATAGSGDVLTGVIAGLMAQGMGEFEAAHLGAYLHGRAADLWLADHRDYPAGMLASELAGYIPAALAEAARA